MRQYLAQCILALAIRLCRFLGQEVIYRMVPTKKLEALEDRMEHWAEEHRVVPMDLDKEYLVKGGGQNQWIKNQD